MGGAETGRGRRADDDRCDGFLSVGRGFAADQRAGGLYSVHVAAADSGHADAGAGELYSQMVQMARTAVSRTKSALRIHSPSGVFADEVGAWIPGGIGEGVLSREDDALGPLEEVRASMVDTMTGALSGIDTGWPDAPWNPGGGGGRTVTVTINVTGDWHVRSEQEKQEIISELGERVREELRGL